MHVRSALRIVLFLLVAVSSLQAQTAVARYSGKLKKQVLLSGQSTSLCSIDADGIRMYASDRDKNAKRPEYFLRWKDTTLFRIMLRVETKEEAMRLLAAGSDSIRKRKSKYRSVNALSQSNDCPLSGWRIAIDPGHVAGDLATGKIEGKYVQFPLIENKDTTQIEIVEGVIAWQTADLLRKLLEAEGAEVLLTRQGQGMSAFGKTFNDWKRDDFRRVLDSLIAAKEITNAAMIRKLRGAPDDTTIFREVFRSLELKKRADLINAWQPNISIIIHYNVDEKNTDWLKPTDKNFCMAFIGGGFHTGSLDTPEQRFDFLRLLVSSDLERSEALSGLTVQSLTEKLGLPAARAKDASYLAQNCIEEDSSGVYGRNLALCRMIEGPLVYGETLYQDNRTECRALMQQDYTYGGMPMHVSSRVGKAAEAYYAAIMAYAQRFAR